MLWGEHGFMDLGGMYSLNDFVEFTAKYRARARRCAATTGTT